MKGRPFGRPFFVDKRYFSANWEMLKEMNERERIRARAREILKKSKVKKLDERARTRARAGVAGNILT